MANNQNNVQPKVVTTTTTTTRRRGGRRRRRTPRTPQAGTTTVRRVTTTRQPSRPNRRRRNRFGSSGKSAPSGIRQRITATLGTVGSNQGSSIELESSVLLNPALMKETTGSNQHGPLQIYASTYSLWKIESILLKLTPLVGPSAVSGTAIRASYNPSGQPGSSSWSALGARKHKDTNPGRPLHFYLSGKDFRGPKDGWFFCNTKNDPQMCTAGSIEIHSLGQTVSTYQDKQFVGPLFLAEMTCTWSFKGYNPQPGMLNLVKAELKEKPQEVKIHSRPGEPIVISVPNNSALARTVGAVDLGVDASATPSDIIWQVADTTMDIVTSAFPQPFGWLFRAGWWFLKRIANRKKNGETEPGVPDAGEVTFQVFQSMTDAMNNTPCIATSEADTMNVNVTGWNITQVTPGNVGQPQASAATMRMIGIDPTQPFYLSRVRTVIGGGYLTGFNYNGAQGVPLNGFAISYKNLQGKKVYSVLTYELLDPHFFQENEIDPSRADAPNYPMYKKTANSYEEIGTVYATAGINYETGPIIRWRLALWKASKTTNVKRQPGNNNIVQFFTLQPNLAQAAGYPTIQYKLQYNRATGLPQEQVPVTQGKWYITVFSAIDGKEELNYYGASYPFPTGIYEGGERIYDPPVEVYQSGLAPMSGVPIKFDFPRDGDAQVTLSMVRDMIQQTLAERENQDLPFPSLPPPSEYDDMEIPPLELDEEEKPQGAVGGTEPSLDIRNWVEFGHRKRPPTPFSPIEEEEEEEEESDLEDDDYAEVPSYIKNLLTPEAKKLLDDLKKMGLSHEKAVKAAQGAYPHPAAEVWEAAYHNALVDGLSPPSARDCAWGAVSDYLP